MDTSLARNIWLEVEQIDSPVSERDSHGRESSGLDLEEVVMCVESSAARK